MVQEVAKQVPVPQVQAVEVVVEVPQVQVMEKIVEVPQVQTVEKIVQAPQIVETFAPAPIMSAPIVETFAPTAFAPSYATAPLVGSISAGLPMTTMAAPTMTTMGAPVGAFGSPLVGTSYGLPPTVL